MDIATAQGLLQQAISDAAANPYPSSRFTGRGIVIAAGGERLLTGAYVAVKRLRALGCTLPIQVWYVGAAEVSAEWLAVFADVADLTFVDAEVVAQTYPATTLASFALKPYAILNCSFAEVLYLDGDNVPVRDPTFLFDSQAYTDTGVLLWPDQPSNNTINDVVWTITGLTKPAGPEIESGELVFDKARAWQALQVTHHFNQQSDYYYTVMFGDKDTYRLGCLLTSTPFTVMPAGTMSPYMNVYYQVDADSVLLFQHRVHADFSLYYDEAIGGFQDQTECFALLAELRAAMDAANYWQTTMGRLNPCNLAVRTLRFLKPSYGESVLQCNHDGTVQNATYHETSFTITRESMQTTLNIFDADGNSSLKLWLYLDGERELWIGMYTFADKMPVVLLPT